MVAAPGAEPPDSAVPQRCFIQPRSTQEILLFLPPHCHRSICHWEAEMRRLRPMLPGIAICRATHARRRTAARHPVKSRNLYFHACSSVLACSYANIWHSRFGKLSRACRKLAGRLPGPGEKGQPGQGCSMGYSFDSSPSHVRSSKTAQRFLLYCFPGIVRRAGSLGRERPRQQTERLFN